MDFNYKFGAVALLLIVLYMFFCVNVAEYENYLEGFWLAEQDDFCEGVDVDSILIYFGPATVSRTGVCRREGHLIMMPEVENQGFTIEYRRGWGGPTCGPYKIQAHVTFDEEQVWADDVFISWDMRSGYLTVTNRDTKFARVCKQHSL
jgi:hypothetical protein